MDSLFPARLYALALKKKGILIVQGRNTSATFNNAALVRDIYQIHLLQCICSVIISLLILFLVLFPSFFKLLLVTTARIGVVGRRICFLILLTRLADGLAITLTNILTLRVIRRLIDRGRGRC